MTKRYLKDAETLALVEGYVRAKGIRRASLIAADLGLSVSYVRVMLRRLGMPHTVELLLNSACKQGSCGL